MAEVSDEKLAGALRAYVALVGPVLDDEGALASTPPRPREWATMSPEQRVSWWVTRFGALAGAAAAAPRAAGVWSDRLPLQDTLGAAASGLAVCAVAREYGRQDPAAWVPLLAQVLFARDLPPDAGAGPSTGDESDERAEAGGPDGSEQSTDGATRRSVRTLWRLARTFQAVNSLFDERPRGHPVARGVAKIPLVGVAGGWFDERGAMQKAAARTRELIGVNVPS
jgi:hypothetical protein